MKKRILGEKSGKVHAVAAFTQGNRMKTERPCLPLDQDSLFLKSS